MGKFMWKKAAAAAMTATILATSATVLQAAAPPDGHTNAQDTVEAYGGAYSNWMTKWNSTISKDREQISLSPGSDNSSLNFAWYTKKASGIQKLKIAENKRLTNRSRAAFICRYSYCFFRCCHGCSNVNLINDRRNILSKS